MVPQSQGLQVWVGSPGLAGCEVMAPEMDGAQTGAEGAPSPVVPGLPFSL